MTAKFAKGRDSRMTDAQRKAMGLPTDDEMRERVKDVQARTAGVTL